MINVVKLLKGENLEALATKSGISKSTMENWKYNNRQPGLANFEAVIEVMGLELILREKNDEK